MKAFLLALTIAILSVALAPSPAEARRFGGGGAAGMKRSLPTRSAPQAVPAKPATPTAAPAAAGATPAAAAAKRSWMGPIAGLAAGLGIAALMSHLGLGAEFGNIVMIILLGALAIVAIRLLARRFAPATPGALATPQGMQYAGLRRDPEPASAGSAGFAGGPASAYAAAPEAGAATLPDGFDAAAFERIAKMIFIRMQTANDAGDLNDLRAFTTPEMYAAVKLELQERAGRAQQTDVVRVDAQVLDVAGDANQQIVSVRFHGLIREEAEAPAEPFDEVWHLVKPLDGSREWAIAGIQQAEA